MISPFFYDKTRYVFLTFIRAPLECMHMLQKSNGLTNFKFKTTPASVCVCVLQLFILNVFSTQALQNRTYAQHFHKKHLKTYSQHFKVLTTSKMYA